MGGSGEEEGVGRRSWKCLGGLESCSGMWFTRKTSRTWLQDLTDDLNTTALNMRDSAETGCEASLWLQKLECGNSPRLQLQHVKVHSLSGIIRFAPILNVYNLNFFHELREIKVFGTWPVAILSMSEEKVDIEGPVRDSSQLSEWHLRKMNNNDTGTRNPRSIQASSFPFNSSVLWDPKSWGWPSSSQVTSDQDSIKFVKEIVDEDEANVKGIPGDDCYSLAPSPSWPCIAGREEQIRTTTTSYDDTND